MRPEERLLQAIIEAPDDDVPRMAYADAIEKQGNTSRAEFIRVQCSLAKMDLAAPQREQLQAREQELLDQFGLEWAEEFKTDFSEWEYHRGFIERVEMHLERPADEILRVLRKAPIRHIRDLTQLCELSSVVEVLPHLEHLTGLEFWSLYAFDNQLVAQILASPHLRNLRTLILHHDRNGNLVDEDVLIEAMASPYRARLQELGVNIDGTWRGPSCALIQAMAKSPSLRQLRKLHLSSAGDTGNRARMDLETIRCLGQSPNFANLEELDFGRTSFPLELWDEVLKWPWLSNLKWLRLHYARQVEPPEFFYTVAEIENLPVYRQAVEDRVETVDWDTEFISPWDEDTCWHGISREVGYSG